MANRTFDVSGYGGSQGIFAKINVLQISLVLVADNGNGTYTVYLTTIQPTQYSKVFANQSDATTEAALWCTRINGA